MYFFPYCGHIPDYIYICTDALLFYVLFCKQFTLIFVCLSLTAIGLHC